MSEAPTHWVIVNTNNRRLFYNQEQGWVDAEFGPTLFTDEQHKHVQLPLEGDWQEWDQ